MSSSNSSELISAHSASFLSSQAVEYSLLTQLGFVRFTSSRSLLPMFQLSFLTNHREWRLSTECSISCFSALSQLICAGKSSSVYLSSILSSEYPHFSSATVVLRRQRSERFHRESGTIFTSGTRLIDPHGSELPFPYSNSSIVFSLVFDIEILTESSQLSRYGAVLTFK